MEWEWGLEGKGKGGEDGEEEEEEEGVVVMMVEGEDVEVIVVVVLLVEVEVEDAGSKPATIRGVEEEGRAGEEDSFLVARDGWRLSDRCWVSGGVDTYSGSGGL